MTESIKKALIYVRSATVRYEAFTLLASQEEYCRKLAKSSGYQVKQVFRDEGEPGSTLDRPGLNALFDELLATNGPYTVLVTNRDRLTRDYNQWPVVLDRLAKSKAELIVAKEGASPLPSGLTLMDRFVLARLSLIEEVDKV